jgi:hypothetical protein
MTTKEMMKDKKKSKHVRGRTQEVHLHICFYDNLFCDNVHLGCLQEKPRKQFSLHSQSIDGYIDRLFENTVINIFQEYGCNV